MIDSVLNTSLPKLLGNLYSDLMLCTASDQVYGALFKPSKLSFIKEIFGDIIKAYSGLFRHIRHLVAYSQPCHIPNPNTFRTSGIFKTLWNFDQTFRETCHSWISLFRHYSVIFKTLCKACIFRNLEIQNTSIMTILEHSEHWHNEHPTHIQNSVKDLRWITSQK